VATIAVKYGATEGEAMKVGVRELRNNLSRYLERVRAGDEVVVTDHGREIAKVVSIDNDDRKPNSLDRLVADGLASPARKDHRSLSDELIPADCAVSPLVADQRR
jgi:prevent-host-death family protein